MSDTNQPILLQRLAHVARGVKILDLGSRGGLSKQQTAKVLVQIRWCLLWGVRFQPVKCNMMQLTKKHSNKIQPSYYLEGTVLENVDNIKYLGVTITSDLRWNTYHHIHFKACFPVCISAISVLKLTEPLVS